MLYEVITLLISPLPNWIILAGYVAGALLRGLMVGGVVLAVSLFFTPIEVQHPLIMVSMLLLTAIVFALAGMVRITSYNVCYTKLLRFQSRSTP